ncbi:hypothetical protein [Rhodospirillum sp. A1_3_36]|uniref:hypothetical protein n=1 Tax=Rhodospirillum sp. A1_3_36 TaxID=3391666 RepID=UPI0039A55ED6
MSFVGMVLATQAWGMEVETGLPPLKTNDWNFILVPSFEGSAVEGSNNLSVQGLNHALRFAQVLDGAVAGKESAIKGLYALTPKTAPQDLAPLESIEPFAVLNNRAVTVSSLTMKTPTAWDGTEGFLQGIVGDSPKGTYVFSGGEGMITAMAQGLGAKLDKIPEGADYLVASGNGGHFTLTAYDDGLTAVNTYPEPVLPPPMASCAMEKAVTFSVDPPKGFSPQPNQTVYMVRHVEAHPTPAFEDGNYVCQGQWRALGVADRLLEVLGGRAPDYVYGPNPASINRCQEGACSYIRATMTVAPFAIKTGLPLTLAAFDWNNGTDLAESLFNPASPYFQWSKTEPQTILVGWEHDHIVKAAQYVIADLYQNPAAAKDLPPWAFNDYDSIWKLETDANGVLTFSNSCELIDSASLPTTCPAFFPK